MIFPSAFSQNDLVPIRVYYFSLRVRALGFTGTKWRLNRRQKSKTRRKSQKSSFQRWTPPDTNTWSICASPKDCEYRVKAYHNKHWECLLLNTWSICAWPTDRRSPALSYTHFLYPQAMHGGRTDGYGQIMLRSRQNDEWTWSRKISRIFYGFFRAVDSQSNPGNGIS